MSKFPIFHIFVLGVLIFLGCSQPKNTNSSLASLSFGMNEEQALTQLNKTYTFTDSIIFYKGMTPSELRKKEVEVYIRRLAPFKIGNQYGILNLFFDSSMKLSQVHWVRFPFYNALCTLFGYYKSDDTSTVKFMQQLPSLTEYKELAVVLNKENFAKDPLIENQPNKMLSKDQLITLEFQPTSNNITLSWVESKNNNIFERYYWIIRPVDTSSVLNDFKLGTPKSLIETKYKLHDTVLDAETGDQMGFGTIVNCFGFDGTVFLRFDSLNHLILFDWYYDCKGNSVQTEYAVIKCLSEVEKYFPEKMDLYPPEHSTPDHILYYATPSAVTYYIHRPASLINLVNTDTRVFPQPDFLKIHTSKLR